MPMTNYSFEVEFKPQKEGLFENIVHIETILNQFENSKFKLKGESFFEILGFEGLESEEDKLDFGDLLIANE
jgi:hypothetical protein